VPTDVIVIGGGPAGYASAIALAQGGARVRLVEEAEPGGTCIHRGCIPTKALLESARLAREVRGASDFGLALPVGAPEVDWAAVRRRQERVVAALAAGLAQLLKANGVTVVRGRGVLVAPAMPGAPPAVRVSGPDGGELRGDALVLAPGSAPSAPAIPGREHPAVVDSDGLLQSADGPRRLAIIGGGAIGCEFATAHAAFGAEVTILEAMPQLLPAADVDIARRLEAAFRRRGIAVHTGVRVLRIDQGPRVVAETPTGPLECAADAVLIATGRRPRTDGMGLDEAGIRRTPAGAIEVDGRFRCVGAEGVWAAGDALGGPMLAHAGFAHASAVAADILGRPAPALAPIPFPVYSHPEVAWVGASETAPGSRAVKIPFGALGRAHTAGETDGLCKVVADHEGRVIGVHLVGAHATELIGAGCIAVSRGLRADDLAAVPFPHPTLAEALPEAAHLLLGHPLHVLPPQRR
jgi:dihydrolipoamide dehydrogenase